MFPSQGRSCFIVTHQQFIYTEEGRIVFDNSLVLEYVIFSEHDSIFIHHWVFSISKGANLLNFHQEYMCAHSRIVNMLVYVSFVYLED